MYPVQDNDEELGVEVEVAPAAPNSYIDLFKEELANLASIEDIFIPVEMYEFSGVSVKYRMPKDSSEIIAIANKHQRTGGGLFQKNLQIMMDTMIKLCEGIYVNPPSEQLDEPVPLDPDDSGFPVTFSDDRLGFLLGMEDASTATARQVLRKFFRDNDFAIIDHASKLDDWIRNTKAKVTDELQLGEL